MFNEIDWLTRIQEEGYTCCIRSTYPNRQLKSEPTGQLVTGLLFGYRDRQGHICFYAHCWIREDGTLAGSGLLDPKLLCTDDKTCYRVDLLDTGSNS